MSLYIKKVDKSLLESGKATLDKKQLEDNEWLGGFEVGDCKDIKVYFNSNEYKCKIAYKSRNKEKTELPYFQLTIGENLKKELRKTFIHTVLGIRTREAIKSVNGKQNLRFNEEALSIELLKKQDEYVLKLSVFIKVNTEYDEYFKALIKSNLIDYPLNSDNKKVIISATKWMDITELDKHKGQRNIIYYLLKSDNKEIYIGSSYLLENRVTTNKVELPNWDKFRYEVVNPDYTAILRDIEYMIIRNYASILKNKDQIPSLEVGDYSLVNNKCYKLN